VSGTGFNVVSSSCAEGAKCIKKDDNIDGLTTRGFVPRLGGHLILKSKKGSTAGTYFLYLMDSSGNTRGVVSWQGRGGEIEGKFMITDHHEGFFERPVGNYSIGAWDTIEVQYEGIGSCGVNEYRARINFGGWTSCFVMFGSGDVGILRFNYGNTSFSGDKDFWIDDITIQ
jgi:hypothetical protein